MPIDEDFQTQSDHQAYTLIALEYAYWETVLAEFNAESEDEQCTSQTT